MLKFRLFVFFQCGILLLSAQNMLGLSGSNFSGTQAMYMNPSSIAAYPFKWDVNIITLNVFTENNYAFYPKASILGLPKLFANGTPEYSTTTTKPKFKSALLDFSLQGPAFFIPYKDHRFGAFINVRTMFSANRIHQSIPDIALNFISGDGALDTNKFDIPSFRINGMAWSEYGLTYAKKMLNQSNEHISFGINVKYLHGFLSAFTNNNFAEFDATDSGGLFFIDVSNEYGYVDPTKFGQNGKSGLGRFINGKGWGVDLGVTYEKKRVRKGFFLKHTKSFKEKYKKLVDYQWKLGVSLLDIGLINFKNTNRYLLQVNNATIPQIDSGQLTQLSDVDNYLSSSLYGDPEKSIAKNKLKMRLPTAMSVQMDYHIRDEFYLNLIWMQRFALPGPGLDRANYLAVVPRLERKWYDLSLPLILYQYKYPSIGFAIRLAYFSIGTDNLTPFFIKQKKLSGANIFFSLKFVNFKMFKRSWDPNGNIYKSPKYVKKSFKI